MNYGTSLENHPNRAMCSGLIVLQIQILTIILTTTYVDPAKHGFVNPTPCQKTLHSVSALPPISHILFPWIVSKAPMTMLTCCPHAPHSLSQQLCLHVTPRVCRSHNIVQHSVATSTALVAIDETYEYAHWQPGLINSMSTKSVQSWYREFAAGMAQNGSWLCEQEATEHSLQW